MRAERGQAERCVSCPVGRYKAKPGEGMCDASDKALFAGSVECRCNTGYYRGLADSKVCFDDLDSVLHTSSIFEARTAEHSTTKVSRHFRKSFKISSCKTGTFTSEF